MKHSSEELVKKEKVKIESITPFNLIFVVLESLKEDGINISYKEVEEILRKVKEGKKIKKEYKYIEEKALNTNRNINSWYLEEDTDMQIYTFKKNKGDEL